MTASDRSTAGRAPLEVELSASEHQRRCLLTDEAGRDEIDMAAAEPEPEGSEP